jgi:diguanylate cyclase (GGDEF)-like protein
MRQDRGPASRSPLSTEKLSAAKQASVLFLASGTISLITNHLPGIEFEAVSDVAGLVAILISPFGWLLPWHRWSERATLAYFPFFLALVVTSSIYNRTPTEVYGVWYVVAFVWIGMNHPSRTSLYLAAPASIAYLIPLLVVAEATPDAARSVAIAIPAAVLVGEVLSATNASLREARAAQEEATGLLAVAVVTDDLTGVGNRRHVTDLLATLADGDALLLLDLDKFKEVNDRLGHLVGDQVLAALGLFLRTGIRDTADGVARYGGEEFLVVLRRPGDAAAPAADRLLQTWRDTKPLVTFSIGMSIHRKGQSPTATLAEADEALYRAKGAGRNCWRAHPSVPHDAPEPRPAIGSSADPRGDVVEPGPAPVVEDRSKL